MQDTQAFAPFYKVTVPGSSGQTGTLMPSITVAATAAGAAASDMFPGSPPNSATQLQIANTALTGWAYVNLGIFGAVVTATVTSGFPVPPLATRVISVDPEVTGASVIMSAGTGNVTFTRGQGVGG